MKRADSQASVTHYVHAHTRFSATIENCKRRQSLTPYVLDTHSRVFFERILSVPKMREFVFIHKSSARSK